MSPISAGVSLITNDACNGDGKDHGNESPIPPHPLGIRPLGNRYLSTGPNARELLGSLEALPDEVLMTLLEHLDQYALQTLGYTCKFLFAFCSSEELWKAVFLE